MPVQHGLTATLLLLSTLSFGCALEPFASSVDEEGPPASGIKMSVVDTAASGVYVSARWSRASDPSGIHHYEWINWRSSPDSIIAQDTTSLLADTFFVSRPPMNETHTFGFEIRAMDIAGNMGAFSQPHMWSLSNADTIAPPPPDTIIVDTLVASIAVWPHDVSLTAGEEVQFYAAVKYDDGSVRCDVPPAAPGARYDSGTFCCGCDSAIAALGGGSSPVDLAFGKGPGLATLAARRIWGVAGD